MEIPTTTEEVLLSLLGSQASMSTLKALTLLMLLLLSSMGEAKTKKEVVSSGLKNSQSILLLLLLLHPRDQTPISSRSISVSLRHHHHLLWRFVEVQQEEAKRFSSSNLRFLPRDLLAKTY